MRWKEPSVEFTVVPTTKKAHPRLETSSSKLLLNMHLKHRYRSISSKDKKKFISLYRTYLINSFILFSAFLASTRRSGNARSKPPGFAPGHRRLDRGAFRTLPPLPVHRLQEHEEVLAALQAQQRGSGQGAHHPGGRWNGSPGCQRHTILASQATDPPRHCCSKLRVSIFI